MRKCINDCNRLATPIDLIKNCTDIFTKSQLEAIKEHQVRIDRFSNTTKVRAEITNFHSSVFNNCLPMKINNFCCNLCFKEKPSSWHLFLECPIMQKIEIDALKLLYSNRKRARRKQNERIRNTISGADKISQSLTWTHNWTIWKTYNYFAHNNEIKYHLHDIFIHYLSMEEFRTMNMENILSNRVDRKYRLKWNKNSWFYRFKSKKSPCFLQKKNF